MQLGVYDYLQKPLDIDEVSVVVKRLFEHQELQQQVHELREQLRFDPSDRMIGRHPKMLEVFKTIGRIASTSSRTRRSACGKGSGLSSTPFTTLKIAAFIPIPSASVSTATAVKPRFFVRVRRAKRMSCVASSSDSRIPLFFGMNN